MEAGEEEDEQPMMMESHRYKRSSGEAEDTEGVSARLQLHVCIHKLICELPRFR